MISMYVRTQINLSSRRKRGPGSPSFPDLSRYWVPACAGMTRYLFVEKLYLQQARRAANFFAGAVRLFHREKVTGALNRYHPGIRSRTKDFGDLTIDCRARHRSAQNGDRAFYTVGDGGNPEWYFTEDFGFPFRRAGEAQRAGESGEGIQAAMRLRR